MKTVSIGILLAAAVIAASSSTTTRAQSSDTPSVCIEHLPNCGSDMTAGDWKRYNAMSRDEQDIYVRKLWEEHDRKRSADNSSDFLARAKKNRANGGGDFLAEAKSAKSNNAVGGDFLARARKKRDEERQQAEQRRQRARNARAVAAAIPEAKTENFSQSNYQRKVSANRPVRPSRYNNRYRNRSDHQYRVIGYLDCQYTYSGEQANTYTITQIGVWRTRYSYWTPVKDNHDRKLKPWLNILQDKRRINSAVRFGNYVGSAICQVKRRQVHSDDVESAYDEMAEEHRLRIKRLRDAGLNVRLSDAIGGDEGALD